MKKGDRVRVTNLVFGKEQYPWVPNSVGQEGVIVDDISVKGGDESLFIVKFDTPFKVKRPPEGEMAYGYDPPESEKKGEDEWALLQSELVVV